MKKAFNNPNENDPTSPDANDDEVQEINRGKENRTENKPGLLPSAETMEKNRQLDLGLPSRGTFVDPRETQNQPNAAPVSTQSHFKQAEILQAKSFRPPGASN